MTTVTVELTVREANALANTANLFADLCAEEPVVKGRVLATPLATGAAKLEIALMTEGCVDA